MVVLNPTIFLCLNTFFSGLEHTSRVLLVNIYLENGFEFPVENFNIEKMENPPFGTEKIDIYVVNKDEVGILELIETLRSHDRFNPRALFLFIGRSMDDNDLKKLTSYFILNTYLVNSTNGDISTYLPFPNAIYPSSDHILEKNGSAMSCSDKTFLQNKIPNDWKYGTIKVCISPSPPSCINENEGIFPETFTLLAQHLNMTIIWKEDLLPIGGFWIQHYHKVFYEGKCDIHMGYLMVENDFLTAFAFDSAYWFVPSTKEIEKWTFAFRVFTMRSWCFWMIFIVFLSIVWGVCTYLMTGERFIVNFLFAFISIMDLFIEQCQKFSHNLITSDILIYLMFFLSFLMNMLFKSRYPFLLIGVHYESIRIQNFQDIMDEDMTVGVPDYFLHFFRGKPEVENYIKSHHHLCYIDNVCVRRTAFERDLATVQVNMFYMYDRKKLLDANGRDLVRKLQPAIVSSTMNAILARGHPLSDILDKHMMLILDHGFSRKIIKKYEYDQGSNMDFDLIKLGVGHIMLPLAIFSIGVLISLLVFIVEVFKKIPPIRRSID